MRSTKKVSVALITTLVIVLASMFIQIVPCQTAPNIPGAQYVWKLCALDPDTSGNFNINKKYFGYSEDLTTTYIILSFLAFIAVLTILHFTARERKK